MGDDRKTAGSTPFSTILRYVLGFMGAMAVLAFCAVWLIRHC